MRRWEYLQAVYGSAGLYVDTTGRRWRLELRDASAGDHVAFRWTDLGKALGVLAAEGWELVGAVGNASNGTTTLFFKRPLSTGDGENGEDGGSGTPSAGKTDQ